MLDTTIRHFRFTRQCLLLRELAVGGSFLHSDNNFFKKYLTVVCISDILFSIAW